MKTAWTDDEDRRLREMKAAGIAHDLIGIQLGRSYNAVKDRWRHLCKSPEEQQRRRDYVNANRKRWRTQVCDPLNVVKTGRASDDLLRERDIRLATPRTLSAVIFGDPPPGYSALDRKRAEQRA